MDYDHCQSVRFKGHGAQAAFEEAPAGTEVDLHIVCKAKIWIKVNGKWIVQSVEPKHGIGARGKKREDGGINVFHVGQ